eukprot:9745936-Prorocentrum_lima.AAC.1
MVHARARGNARGAQHRASHRECRGSPTKLLCAYVKNISRKLLTPRSNLLAGRADVRCDVLAASVQSIAGRC